MSGGSFFGSAGGFLGLCLGLSAMSVVEIFYHVFLFIIAICRGREMSETHYKSNKLPKLGDAIAISKSETMNHSLTDPLTH